MVRGRVGLAIECTIASVPLNARTDGDVAAVETALRDNYGPRMNNLATKVAELAGYRPDLKLDGVEEWHYLLVYKESLPFLGILRPKLLDPHLTAAGRATHLLSIAEFENLVAVEPSATVDELLREKSTSVGGASSDFRAFLHRATVSRGIGAQNKMLVRAQEEVLGPLLTAH